METKPFYTSVTLWGVLVTILAALSNRFNWGLGDQQMHDATNALMFLGGVIWTIYGRIRQGNLSVRKTYQPPPPPTSGLRMLWLLMAVGASFTAMSLCVTPGCSTPPTSHQIYATSDQAYVTTLASLNAARQAGKITDGQWLEIVGYAEVCNSALDAWRAALDAGTDSSQAQAAFSQDLTTLENLNHGPSPPTTHP